MLNNKNVEELIKNMNLNIPTEKYSELTKFERKRTEIFSQTKIYCREHN